MKITEAVDIVFSLVKGKEKLQRKIIIDKNGRRKTVWVRPPEMEFSKQPISLTEKKPQKKLIGNALEPALMNLPGEELKALIDYSIAAYGPINRNLRAGAEMPERYQKTAELIESALNKFETKKEIVTYRFAGDSGNPQDIFSKLEEGDNFIENGFLSSSTSEHTVNQMINDFEYYDNYLPWKMIITIPPGVKGAYIESISNSPEEAELLLQKETALLVTKKDDKKKTIELEVIVR